jgi:hypothetical protein
MEDNASTSGNIYGRLTGRKRLAIVVLGAVSGALVALLFSLFSGRPAPAWEIIIGAFGGALLGLSASLGEVRRKKNTSDEHSSPPRDG